MHCERIHLKEIFTFLGENGRDPFVDVYCPANLVEMGWDDQRHPCLVVCPGGAYSMCSQREAEPVALSFLAKNFNVFVLNYSVAPHAFPHQLREVAAVMELISRNAEKWHCDAQHVAIMGFSAGGHLAAHYTNAFDIPEVREKFPDSKGVQASLLCYPVLCADKQYTHVESICNLAGHEDITPEEIEKFSCQNLVSKKTPPTFLWHTAPDLVVPVENSLFYAQALAHYEVPFELHIYPFGGHGLATVTEETCNALPDCVSRNAVWMAKAIDWLKMTFRGK